MRTGDDDAPRLIDLLSRGWDGALTPADNEVINSFLLERLGERSQLLLQVSALHLEIRKQVASARLFERVMSDVVDSTRIAMVAGRGYAAAGRSKLHPQASKGVESKALNSQAVDFNAVDSKVSVAKYSKASGRSTWGIRDPGSTNTGSTNTGPFGSRLARRSLAVAAICACLFVAVGTWFLRGTPWADSSPSYVAPRITHLLRPSRPVASVVAVHQAVWGEGSDVRVGQTIEENARMVLLSGRAQLSMTCGADIVLQGPCEVTLLSHDLARLDSGTLTAHSAEWATGFAVLANDLKVTDLGTRFALTSDSQGVVEAHVIEGLVLAEPLKQRRPQEASLLLKSGQAIRVNTVSSQVDLIEARQMDFVSGLVDFRPLRPIPIWNTGIGAPTGASDPHWTITAGSDQHGPYPRLATIQTPVSTYEDNKPDISQWISLSATPYPGVPPNSVHTFETKFDLTGYDLSTVYIVGYFLVDDAINELRINGYPVKFNRWVTTWDQYDFKSFHAIEITDHFIEGENTISIDLYNSPSNPNTPNAPNPTALRVEWQAFGCTLSQ